MDFTEVSVNALRYAIDMFGIQGEFTLVHATTGIATINGEFDPGILESRMEFLERRLESIANEVVGVTQLPNNFTLKVLVGNPVLSITSFVKEEGADFKAMVLGTRDQYDFFDKWMGTISLGLVKKLDIPVYLIPIYASFEGIDKVMIASDYQLKDTKAIINVSKWNNEHNAEVKFLHIHPDSSKSYKEEREEILNDLFRKENSSANLEIEVIQGRNISDTLLGKAYNYHADLLVVFPENHSFVHTLLFKSISKELILKSDIPILFFPKDYEYIPNAKHVEWTSWKTDYVSE